MDTPQLVLAPVLATGVNVVVHVALCHLLSRNGQRAAILLGFAAGLVAAVALTVAALPGGMGMADRLGYFVLNQAGYWGLAFCYFNFVNLNIASLRIRVLKELLAAPDRQLDVGSLLGRYNAATVLETRLRRLVDGRQLVLRDGRYYSGQGVFLCLARIMNVVKATVFGSAAVRRFDK